MQLEDLRAQIDRLDHQLIDTLAKRQQIVFEVAEYKKRNGLPPLQPERFAALLAERVSCAEQQGLDPETIETIWHAIHDASVKTQENLV